MKKSLGLINMNKKGENELFRAFGNQCTSRNYTRSTTNKNRYICILESVSIQLIKQEEQEQGQNEQKNKDKNEMNMHIKNFYINECN